MLIVSVATAWGQVRKETLPGAVNFSRVDATVACGGATDAGAFAELKRQGFVSVINLRTASEPGANVEAEGKIVEAAGLKYIHIPIVAGDPDPARIETFLAEVATKANQPVYIHCGSANRVGAMWFVKRVVQDGWDEAKALEEARAIGLTNQALEQFVRGYVKARRK